MARPSSVSGAFLLIAVFSALGTRALTSENEDALLGPSCILPSDPAVPADRKLENDLKEIIEHDRLKMQPRKAYRMFTERDKMVLSAAIKGLRKKSTNSNRLFPSDYAAIAAYHGVGSSLKITLQDGSNRQVCMCFHRGQDFASTAEANLTMEKEINPLFLLWHRAYLYAFELSLRLEMKAQGLPEWMEFRLPYWDWSNSSRTTRRMEAEAICKAFFSESVAGNDNPLFHKDRAFEEPCDAGRLGELAALGSTRNAISFNIDESFDVFEQSLFSGWHSAVHTGIGKDMADPLSAANDPLFWLHHANIDRMWMEWNRLSANRDRYGRELGKL